MTGRWPIMTWHDVLFKAILIGDQKKSNSQDPQYPSLSPTSAVTPWEEPEMFWFLRHLSWLCSSRKELKWLAQYYSTSKWQTLGSNLGAWIKGTLVSLALHPPPEADEEAPSWQMEEESMLAADCDYKLPSSRFSSQWFSYPRRGNCPPNQRLNHS